MITLLDMVAKYSSDGASYSALLLSLADNLCGFCLRTAGGLQTDQFAVKLKARLLDKTPFSRSEVCEILTDAVAAFPTRVKGKGFRRLNTFFKANIFGSQEFAPVTTAGDFVFRDVRDWERATKVGFRFASGTLRSTYELLLSLLLLSNVPCVQPTATAFAGQFADGNFTPLSGATDGITGCVDTAIFAGTSVPFWSPLSDEKILTYRVKISRIAESLTHAGFSLDFDDSTWQRITEREDTRAIIADLAYLGFVPTVHNQDRRADLTPFGFQLEFSPYTVEISPEVEEALRKNRQFLTDYQNSAVDFSDPEKWKSSDRLVCVKEGLDVKQAQLLEITKITGFSYGGLPYVSVGNDRFLVLSEDEVLEYYQGTPTPPDGPNTPLPPDEKTDISAEDIAKILAASAGLVLAVGLITGFIQKKAASAAYHYSANSKVGKVLQAISNIPIVLQFFDKKTPVFLYAAARRLSDADSDFLESAATNKVAESGTLTDDLKPSLSKQVYLVAGLNPVDVKISTVRYFRIMEVNLSEAASMDVVGPNGVKTFFITRMAEDDLGLCLQCVHLEDTLPRWYRIMYDLEEAGVSRGA